MSDNRDDNGQYKQEFADEEFLEAVRGLPVASTQNVADNVGCSYNLAYRRLMTLGAQSRVRKEDVGTSFVWFIH
jgi:hypothetical protein